MNAAPALLAATTLAFGVAALLPRAGRPLMLLLPPGVSAAPAFATPGWRVQRLSSTGPFTLVTAAPDDPNADPAALIRAAGALLALAATPAAACQPAFPEP